MAIRTQLQAGVPANADFAPYLLLALHNKGGQANAEDVQDEVIRLMKFDKKIVDKDSQSDTKTILYKIHWARQILADTGYIDTETRGVWALTSQAKKRISELNTDESRDQFVKEAMEKCLIFRKAKEKNAVQIPVSGKQAGAGLGAVVGGSTIPPMLLGMLIGGCIGYLIGAWSEKSDGRNDR